MITPQVVVSTLNRHSRDDLVERNITIFWGSLKGLELLLGDKLPCGPRRPEGGVATAAVARHRTSDFSSILATTDSITSSIASKERRAGSTMAMEAADTLLFEGRLESETG
jgi:hypothetical protein